MTHRLATNCAKNYCNRTPIVKVIVENVVTCFFETRCISSRMYCYRIFILLSFVLTVWLYPEQKVVIR